MRLLLVCDGSGDIANLKKLTHRILCENHDWLIDHELVWVEYKPGRTFLDIHHVHAAADARKIPTPRGLGMGHGAASAKRAFLLGKKLAGESKELGELGVVFVWDVDNDPKRIAAIDEARASTNGLRIAVGLATPEHEAWCICAFAPETAEEQAAHDAVKGTLGSTRSHAATSFPTRKRRSRRRTQKQCSRGSVRIPRASRSFSKTRR